MEQYGFETVILPADTRLASPVNSHADMLVFVLNKNIFCNKTYFEHNKELFARIAKHGYTLLPCDFNVKTNYPHDIALNQAIVGRYIFGNKSYCSKELLKYANENGYFYVSVKQGYAKCSTLVLNKNAIISADDSILSAARALNIDTLKIENAEGLIILNGYDYGFIGGASAVYENTVFFFGSIDRHKSGRSIIEFCERHGMRTFSLTDDFLTDIGGAFILPLL